MPFGKLLNSSLWKLTYTVSSFLGLLSGTDLVFPDITNYKINYVKHKVKNKANFYWKNKLTANWK